ncbi:MAG: hypothetical protein RLZZ399_2781 [Verrucomicrobiota bacterium]|jgi:hypothetical protein
MKHFAVAFILSAVSLMAETKVYPGSALSENHWLADEQAISQAAKLKFPVSVKAIKSYDFKGVCEYLNGEMKARGIGIEFALVMNSAPSGWWGNISRIPIYEHLGVSKEQFLDKLNTMTCYELLGKIREPLIN